MKDKDGFRHTLSELRGRGAVGHVTMVRLDRRPQMGSRSGLLQSVCPQSSAQHMWSKQIN